MTTFSLLLAIAILSYLIGSIPWGVIISKSFFGFDIRTKGSGNMGSTNAFRILGIKWGIIVQLLDISKGVAAVLLAGLIGEGLSFPNATGFEDLTIIKFSAGIIAIFGHIFTVFAGFKGGKGINTAVGLFLLISPFELSIALLVFVLSLILSGYVSLGSILASLSMPTSMFVRHNILGVNMPSYTFLIYADIFIAVLVIYTHRANIKRLLQGTENHFAKLQLIKIGFLMPKNRENK